MVCARNDKVALVLWGEAGVEQTITIFSWPPVPALAASSAGDCLTKVRTCEPLASRAQLEGADCKHGFGRFAFDLIASATISACIVL